MDANDRTADEFMHWIDGTPQPSRNGHRFEIRSPFDGHVAASFSDGAEADAEAAVSVARRSFGPDGWSISPARQRYEILSEAARMLELHAETIAQQMVVESGKPIVLARGEVTGAVRAFQYYAGLALASEGSAITERTPNAVGLVLREPVGVAGLITAWNFPLLGVVNKAAPALAAGCTAVAKPSPLCSGPTLLLARILSEAGLPDGVFNVVTSQVERGAVVGQYLASSEDVDKIAFTGSTASGRAVMAAAVGNIKRVSLELGGKSANIVFADADLEAAARTAIGGFCFNSGQQCSAGTRLLLQNSIHDEFMQLLTKFAAEQRLGDPSSPATTMGPLISQAQHDKVRTYIDAGGREASQVFEAQLPTELGDGGLFVPPTILDGMSNTSPVAQEEIFGPVLSVIAFDTAEQAIDMANDSRYGLAGGVWTRSLDTAIMVAKSVRTGKMFVNCYNTSGIDDMPHGGYKTSGFGKEFGTQGFDEFLELKTVQILLSA